MVKVLVASGNQKKLAELEAVLSEAPVLTPEIASLARRVADRQGGTAADVLRLAVPARSARLEARWCEEAGLTLGVDAMGTMFATRPGEDPDAADVIEEVFRRGGMHVLNKQRATSVVRDGDAIVADIVAGFTSPLGRYM